MLARGIGIVMRLVSIPFGVRLLGAPEYGLWLTAASVLLWLTLTQAGIHEGLLNEIGRAYGRENRRDMQRHISTAYTCFTLLTVAIAIVSAILSQTPLLITLLGLHNTPELIGPARQVFLLSGLLAAATLLSNVSHAVYSGLQETYIYYAFLSVGYFVPMAALGVLYFTGATLNGYTIAMGLPPALSTAAATIYLFYWRHPELRPRFADFDRDSLRTLLDFGRPLLLIRITEMVIFNSANPMIASRLGVAEVPKYAIPMSMYMVFCNLCNSLTRAWQPGFVEANVRHDWLWIRTTIRRVHLQTIALMCAAVIGGILTGPWIVRVWAGKSIVPSTEMFAWMGIYSFLLTIANTNTAIMLGLGKPRIRAAGSVLVAIAHIAGFFLLMPYLKLLALPLAGSIGFFVDALFIAAYAMLFLRSHLAETPEKRPVS